MNKTRYAHVGSYNNACDVIDKVRELEGDAGVSTYAVWFTLKESKLPLLIDFLNQKFDRWRITNESGTTLRKKQIEQLKNNGVIK